MRRFVRSRYSPLLTHGSLIALFTAMLAMLIWLPWWAVVAPCILVHHRVGILLHEYVHGIPLPRYRHNLLVLMLFDGLLLSFGMLEVFRATHLAHHRWLNTEKDPAMQGEGDMGAHKPVALALMALEGTQHLKYYLSCLRGRYPYVRRAVMLAGVAQSVAWFAFWLWMRRADVVILFGVLHFCTSLASSFRGAVEHHSRPSDPNFANEYRVWIPLFNLNRHIDHHLHPARPWYLLEFRTIQPLPPRSYWTYWYHAYIRRDYVLMAPAGTGHTIRH